MRVRPPFAAAFGVLLLLAGYLGLGSNFDASRYAPYQHSDKGLHFVTFFLLTLTFYWIIDTTRRRVIHFTLLAVTAVLGVGSEILQGVLPNAREFDYLDIAANIFGSLLALGACALYHKRMLERKRAAKSYHAVPGDEETGGAGQDMELDEHMSPQESGMTSSGQKETNISEELDNWDENAEDWDEEESGPAKGDVGSAEGKPSGPTDDLIKSKRDD